MKSRNQLSAWHVGLSIFYVPVWQGRLLAWETVWTSKRLGTTRGNGKIWGLIRVHKDGSAYSDSWFMMWRRTAIVTWWFWRGNGPGTCPLHSTGRWNKLQVVSLIWLLTVRLDASGHRFHLLSVLSQLATRCDGVNFVCSTMIWYVIQGSAWCKGNYAN